MSKISGELQGVLNEVYLAASNECEHREFNGNTIGNGHHMAQKIVTDVEARLAKRFENYVLLSPHVVKALRELLERANMLENGFATTESAVLRELLLILQAQLR